MHAQPIYLTMDVVRMLYNHWLLPWMYVYMYVYITINLISLISLYVTATFIFIVDLIYVMHMSMFSCLPSLEVCLVAAHTTACPLSLFSFVTCHCIDLQPPHVCYIPGIRIQFNELLEERFYDGLCFMKLCPPFSFGSACSQLRSSPRAVGIRHQAVYTSPVYIT